MPKMADVVEMQLKVMDRENEIRDLLIAAKIKCDDVTLMAMLGIVHLTMAESSLLVKGMQEELNMAVEMVELKKKGVM